MKGGRRGQKFQKMGDVIFGRTAPHEKKQQRFFSRQIISAPNSYFSFVVIKLFWQIVNKQLIANFSIFWLISIVFFDIVYMDLLCFVNILKNYNHSAKLAHVYKDVMTIFILINLEVVRKFTKIRLTTFTC